jgi:hypothetical protein
MKSRLALLIVTMFHSTVFSDIIPLDRRIDWSPGIPDGYPDKTFAVDVQDHGALGDGYTIQMRYVAYGRVQRIESNMTYRTHIYLSEAYACAFFFSIQNGALANQMIAPMNISV